MDDSRLRSALFGSKPRIALTVAVALLVVVAVAFALGILGVPGVTGVENRFVAVNDTETTVETDLGVSNPNPIGVALGGTTVNYTVSMNDVTMARGDKEGVRIARGNSTLMFTTVMRNERIPRWWHTHVANGERTDVVVNATVSSPLAAGRSISIPQERTVETDLVGGFASGETRPVDAGVPAISDPALYINETDASWDRANLTVERTPLDTAFTVYNPKQYPYVVTEIGYEIRMNDVVVGEGSTDRERVIPGRTARTIGARTVIDNANLDEWWVSHLERNQVTRLRIDFYAVVDPDSAGVLPTDVEPIRIELDPVDYERTVETDIFGTKAESPTGDPGDGNDAGSGTDEDGTDGNDDPTSTPAEGGSTPTDGSAGEPMGTPTDGPGGDGDATTTDDGGILGIDALAGSGR